MTQSRLNLTLYRSNEIVLHLADGTEAVIKLDDAKHQRAALTIEAPRWLEISRRPRTGKSAQEVQAERTLAKIQKQRGQS